MAGCKKMCAIEEKREREKEEENRKKNGDRTHFKSTRMFIFHLLSGRSLDLNRKTNPE